jgi:hypothetical protein
MGAVVVGIIVGITLGSERSCAAIIDFEGIPATTQISGTPPANTVLTNQFANLGVVFGEPGISAGVAVVNFPGSFAPSSGVNVVEGLDAAGVITNAASADIYFSFVEPGTSTPATTDLVAFTLGDAGGDLDSFILHAFDLNGTEILTQAQGNTSRFAVTLLAPGIHKVHVEFLSDPAGYGLDDLEFNTPTSSFIPEPGSLFIFGGLLAAGVFGFRSRKRTTA